MLLQGAKIAEWMAIFTSPILEWVIWIDLAVDKIKKN
tara:strand:- start:5766 stop:5876 length:111 start_codon:yes stop_codon:yes gene_type:complete